MRSPSKVSALEGESPVEAGDKGKTPVEAGGVSMKPVVAGDLALAGNSQRGTASFAVRTVEPSISRQKVSEVQQGSGIEPFKTAEAQLQESDEMCVKDDCCQLFFRCQVSLLVKNRFEDLCRHSATLVPCAAQLGITLLQLLLVSPRDGEKVRVWINAQWLESSTIPTRVRDLLPLPLPPAGAALKYLEQLKVSENGLLLATDPVLPGVKKGRRQQAKKLLMEGCKQVWRIVIVIVLNGLNSNWLYPPSCRFRLSEHQEAAMFNINRWIEAFCTNPLGPHKLPVFSTLVKSKTIDYAGEEVAHALPLRLEELLPGLPVAGVAGSLSAVEAASGLVKEWVMDPSKTLKSKDLWPKKNPKARINATREEWNRICEELYKRGIIEAIDLQDVFAADDGPVLNGAFAVEKKGQPGEGQVRVTRLIMNFVPANSFQKLMQGDLGTLASSSSWTQLILGPQEVLLWSGDDQRGAFYAWELPKAWRPFMAFAWPVPGELVGKMAGTLEFVASRVIPMGWIQAVSLFQHLHRSLGMNECPAGAGHAAEKEWRRDRPMPQTADGEMTEFVQFYLDDFDCPEICPSVGWEQLGGKLSRTHAMQREAYRRWGVGISEDKAHVRNPKVIRMGAEVDGCRGSVGAPIQKKFEAAYFGLWCMGLHLPPTKVLLMVLGRLVRCFEFRRPLMCLLHNVWPKGSPQMRKPLGMNGLQELLLAMSILPLAGADLRSPVNNMATCSDASEAGGGLCCSGGLTEVGMQALERSQTEEFLKARAMSFQPQGALTVLAVTGPKIVVVSLFDGVAALMCGLCRLDCQVIAFASSEVDKECKRLVRKRWPGVIELGDIQKIDKSKIEALHRSVGYDVDFVLCGGGSPCQDLSALLADREGLAGSRSKLFFEMPRIFKDLRETFRCPVYSFVENVFSMTEDNRNAFSDTLGVEPVLLDSTAFSHSRRPRLYWVDWEIQARDEEKLVEHNRYREWIFPVFEYEKTWWLDKFCKQVSNSVMPTFTRALPRKTPPKRPAGLAGASQQAVDRWTADNYRFQVYQYEDRYMVSRPDGSWRTPSLTERERLMGFPTGYVSSAVSTKLTVNEAFNLGACMLGNSFNVYCITFLLDELLRHFSKSHQPRQLDRILVRDAEAPPGWCEHPKFTPSSMPDECSRRLIHEFLRQGDKGGTDVKLDVGIPFRVKAWPRAGIRSRLFHWKIVNGYAWKHRSHINVLELQAVVHSMQWRLRKLSGFRSRVLHLVDNQVVASVITKGRSSSYRLKRALQKLTALVVAGELRLAIGYVATDDNPSDIPSRWASRIGKQNNIAKRGSKSDKGCRSMIKS